MAAMIWKRCHSSVSLYCPGSSRGSPPPLGPGVPLSLALGLNSWKGQKDIQAAPVGDSGPTPKTDPVALVGAKPPGMAGESSWGAGLRT